MLVADARAGECRRGTSRTSEEVGGWVGPPGAVAMEAGRREGSEGRRLCMDGLADRLPAQYKRFSYNHKTRERTAEYRETGVRGCERCKQARSKSRRVGVTHFGVGVSSEPDAWPRAGLARRVPTRLMRPTHIRQLLPTSSQVITDHPRPSQANSGQSTDSKEPA